MKLQRKRLAILISIVCFVLLLSAAYMASTNNFVKSDTEVPPEIPEDPSGPLLVVPEYSIGTIGALGALIAAVVIFTVISKRK
jgi:hypothetical protein